MTGQLSDLELGEIRAADGSGCLLTYGALNLTNLHRDINQAEKAAEGSRHSANVRCQKSLGFSAKYSWHVAGDDEADASSWCQLSLVVTTAGLGDATELAGLIPAALHGRFALVVTSPPYGPTVHGLVRPTPHGVHKTANRCSDQRDPGNLAHRDWPGLIDGFTRILDGCHRLLRPGGTVVVTARPWRRNSELVDLPSAVVAAGVAAGLAPLERCVALLAALRGGRLVPRPSFFQLQQIRRARTAGIPLHLIAHEDVLVLRRPLSRLEARHERTTSTGTSSVVVTPTGTGTPAGATTARRLSEVRQ